MSRPRWIRQHSSGGVVIRERDGKRELLVIRPAGTDRWQLPKGRVDPGETAREAALREVREEGGVVAEAIAPLDSISYFFRGGGHGYRKEVDYFLMRYVSGDTADHDHEIDEAQWLPAEQFDRLTFRDERGVVEQALRLIASSPD
ncbi:MAG TPA: NUDIX hydrolase [Chloroflexota bacterium]|nr:NUDIX hydrolase [Chloroflexota bacterium]